VNSQREERHIFETSGGFMFFGFIDPFWDNAFEIQREEHIEYSNEPRINNAFRVALLDSLRDLGRSIELFRRMSPNFIHRDIVPDRILFVPEMQIRPRHDFFSSFLGLYPTVPEAEEEEEAVPESKPLKLVTKKPQNAMISIYHDFRVFHMKHLSLLQNKSSQLYKLQLRCSPLVFRDVIT